MAEHSEVRQHKPLLRCFSKQIGGHLEEKSGKPGMVKHEDGTLLKPLLAPPRGPRELQFYQTVFNAALDDLVLQELKPLLPAFYGVYKADWESKDCEFLMLEDVTVGFLQPCIIDLKMGEITYDPEASPTKIKSENSKYQGTKRHGFSIPGVRVFHLGKNQFESHDKEFGKQLAGEKIKEAFAMYLNCNDADSSSVIKCFLSKLRIVENWFKTQHRFAFYSSSLLLVYDAAKLTRKVKKSSNDNALSSTSSQDSLEIFKKSDQINIKRADFKENNTAGSNTGLNLQNCEDLENCDVKKGEENVDHPLSSAANGCDQTFIKSDESESATTVQKRPISPEKEFSQAKKRVSDKPKQEAQNINNENCAKAVAQNGKSETFESRKDATNEAQSSNEDQGNLCELRMIDFAHVFPTTKPDENYLMGLRSIIKIFEELLAES